MTVTTAREIFLLGIEATEGERIARGAPPDCEDLRRMLGLPPRRAHPTPADTDLAAARGGGKGAAGCDSTRTMSEVGGGLVTAPSTLQHGLDDAISGFVAQGHSSRQIAAELADLGYSVSYRTVCRRMRGR